MKTFDQWYEEKFGSALVSQEKVCKAYVKDFYKETVAGLFCEVIQEVHGGEVPEATRAEMAEAAYRGLIETLAEFKNTAAKVSLEQAFRMLLN